MKRSSGFGLRRGSARRPVLAWVVSATFIPAVAPVSGEDSWDLPRAGYARELREAIRKEKQAGGLLVEISVIPDAYRYFLAEGMEQLAELGYSDKKLEVHLRNLHRRYKSQKDKVLLFLKLRSREPSTYFFLSSSLKKHVEVSTDGKRRTFSCLRQEPKLTPERWRVFEYVPDQPRRISTASLSRVKDLELLLISRTLDPEDGPFAVEIDDLLRVPDTGGVVSANQDIRQISCFEISRLFMGAVRLTFSPRRWKIPRPPSGFDEILERLDRK